MIFDKLNKTIKRHSLKDEINEMIAYTVCDRKMTPSAEAISNVLIHKREITPSAKQIETDETKCR